MFRLPSISRRWRWPKVLVTLFVIELAGTIAGLALFGIADPNLYRTRLWQIGFDNGFNSSPSQILYAYANYRPLPKTPFVWSQTLTSYNLVISVLCTFLLLVKAVMFALHIWFPLLGAITNTVITALWLVSIYGQAGPDKSDARHPSNSAWYITKSCSFAESHKDQGYCRQAKAAFAITVFMAFVFLLNLILSIWSMIPSAAERANRAMDVDDMQMAKDSPISNHSSDKQWELKSVPRQQTTPYTPRTLAFNTLDRQLPLRAQGQGARWS